MRFHESLQVNDHYRRIKRTRTLLNTKKLLNNVRGVTEMTFLMKRVKFHPLKQGCVNPWDVWMDVPGD